MLLLSTFSEKQLQLGQVPEHLGSPTSAGFRKLSTIGGLLWRTIGRYTQWIYIRSSNLCFSGYSCALNRSNSADLSGGCNVRLSRLFLLLVVVGSPTLANAQLDPNSLTGLTIDDAEAELVGDWQSSASSSNYLGKAYLHDQAAGKGEKSAKFSFRVQNAGDYQVLIAYTQNGNRAAKVPITVHSTAGPKTVFLDQRKHPELKTGFQSVGQFSFSDLKDGLVIIENKGTSDYVIVDGIRLLTAAEFKKAQADEKSARPKTKPTKKTPPKPQPKAPKFKRRTTQIEFKTISAGEFDGLLKTEDETKEPATNQAALAPITDVKFLRRVSLDLVGRQPSLEEYHAFIKDKSPNRRATAVHRLLGLESFGKNWGNYWSDVIAARQPEPQLTHLNYEPFRSWIGKQINTNVGWDQAVFEMLTAVGTIGDGPAGTFIGFHQGERNKLAGESARIFLGLKISCAQCHDHPFVDMPQETFHGMAAFFARVTVKLPWDSNKVAIASKDSGEHKIPGAKSNIAPIVYDGKSLELGLSDIARREQLAYWAVSGDNTFFARSFVNHVQARLMGRGFFNPVDDLGEGAEPLNAKAHDALAQHFVASNFNVKELFHLLVSTETYQSKRVASLSKERFTGGTPKKLRGDEVFDSLVSAIELPNIAKKVKASTIESRFPPPPKTTRELVNQAFGFDPSTKDNLLTRTMEQAIFMMNNDQIHAQINGSKDGTTMLAKLLKDESDNTVVIDVLYARVFARSPRETERKIVVKHVDSIKDRGAAFEDVLWSLLNSAEFTTRN